MDVESAEALPSAVEIERINALKPGMLALRLKHGEMKSLWRADLPDLEAVLAKQREIDAIKLSLLEISVKAHVKALESMAPEQRKAVADSTTEMCCEQPCCAGDCDFSCDTGDGDGGGGGGVGGGGKKCDFWCSECPKGCGGDADCRAECKKQCEDCRHEGY